MIVATFPDHALAQLVGPVPGVQVYEWDWRHQALSEEVENTTFLVSEYAPGPPDPQVLSVLAALRVVQLPSAGYAGWTDALPDAIALCNGRSIHGQSTAEAAVTGVLALLRGIPDSVVAQQRESWAPQDVEQLSGKRVVIVGAGDIGQRIHSLFTAFGCSTVSVGRTERDGVVPVRELAAITSAADVLVVAVPLTEDTTDLIDAALLQRLPDHAIVANVARGPVVNTAALTAEVASGRLRTYLDVTDPEPLPPGHPLWTLPGSLLTPHTGGGEVHWRSRYADLIREQLIRLRDGRALRNVVR
ncbi:NAD(P)-dependent oxidoreductase [Williamsia sp.]|uniref:NAD(P)-dependent oxidoreductase n=1 Tax=Williamsia sp. TaxID=1872085 RepID=UPI002F957EC0